MDRFTLMQTFVRVAETGSVSAATRVLRVGQPAVSKHLQALETALAARLLQRSTQGIKLTEAGRRYYERAKRLVDELSELESDFADASAGPLRGRMRISAPVTLGELYLARLLAEFASLHPALELDIVLTDQPLGLVETGIDIAIVVGRLADSSHVARKLAVMRCVLVAAPKYLDRQTLPARIDDLAAFEFIRSNPSAQGDVLNFSGPDGRHSIRAQGRLLVNNGVALRELLLAGHGLAVMPLAWVHKDLAAQRLQTVLADYAPDALEVHALYPSARFVPTKLRAIVNFLQEQLPKLPGMV